MGASWLSGVCLGLFNYFKISIIQAFAFDDNVLFDVVDKSAKRGQLVRFIPIDCH